MYVFSYFLTALASIINFGLTAYMWIVIGRALISWVNPDPYNPIVHFLYDVTDPVLSRIRRVLPLAMGGIDFSPMVLILAIMFLQGFLVPTLQHMARSLGG